MILVTCVTYDVDLYNISEKKKLGFHVVMYILFTKKQRKVVILHLVTLQNVALRFLSCIHIAYVLICFIAMKVFFLGRFVLSIIVCRWLNSEYLYTYFVLTWSNQGGWK